MLSAPSVVVGALAERSVAGGRLTDRCVLAAHGPSTFTNIAADELVGSGLIGAWLRRYRAEGSFHVEARR